MREFVVPEVQMLYTIQKGSRSTAGSRNRTAHNRQL